MSAVIKGLAMNIYDAMNNRILDYGYTVSFGRLHEFVAGKDQSQIARAVLFGSRPPPNDSIWKYAERAGFELVLEDRNVPTRKRRSTLASFPQWSKTPTKRWTRPLTPLSGRGRQRFRPSRSDFDGGRLQGGSGLLGSRIERAEGDRNALHQLERTPGLSLAQITGQRPKSKSAR